MISWLVLGWCDCHDAVMVDLRPAEGSDGTRGAASPLCCAPSSGEDSSTVRSSESTNKRAAVAVSYQCQGLMVLVHRPEKSSFSFITLTSRLE